MIFLSRCCIFLRMVEQVKYFSSSGVFGLFLPMFPSYRRNFSSSYSVLEICSNLRENKKSFYSSRSQVTGAYSMAHLKEICFTYCRCSNFVTVVGLHDKMITEWQNKMLVFTGCCGAQQDLYEFIYCLHIRIQTVCRGSGTICVDCCKHTQGTA